MVGRSFSFWSSDVDIYFKDDFLGGAMPEIKDVIIHGKYSQISLIIDKRPVFIYDRKDNHLVAKDDGFYSCFRYEKPSDRWQAFGGRKFDIPMKDGTIEHAFGQWWDDWKKEFSKEEVIHCGAKTIDGLNKCYVFTSCIVHKSKVNKWLEKNTPSTDYYKYERKPCQNKD